MGLVTRSSLLPNCFAGCITEQTCQPKQSWTEYACAVPPGQWRDLAQPQQTPLTRSSSVTAAIGCHHSLGLQHSQTQHHTHEATTKSSWLHATSHKAHTHMPLLTTCKCNNITAAALHTSHNTEPQHLQPVSTLHHNSSLKKTIKHCTECRQPAAACTATQAGTNHAPLR